MALKLRAYWFPVKKNSTIIVFGLLLIIFILQSVNYLHPKLIRSPAWSNNTYFQAQYVSESPHTEKQYRKRFNLVDGNPESVIECTIGNTITMD